MANNKMTASQIKKMKDIINDPIKWAQAFIRIYDASKKQDTPWIARWYQGEALRDKSLRKVLRQGRRTGKCLPGWVKILDPTTGKLNTVEEIYNNKKCNLVTMNKDYKLENHKTNIIFKNGIKKVYRIKLESGREIDATDNHPLYSRCGWTEVKKLIPGNYVAVPKILNYFGNKTMDLKKMKDLALNSSKECVPKDIFELEKSNIAYYLHIIFSYGIFTAYDEYIEPQIVKICESKELSIDIQHLLLRFGINSVLYEKEKSKVDGYYLIIKGKHNLQLFKDKIGLKNRNQELDYCINNSTTKEIKNNEQDVVYEKILSIKYIDKVMTYDLTVPITHNFIANDIITHNTEEMVIEMLWRVFTNRNYRCLTVTPYENQVRLQFQRIREIIDSSPLLKNEVVSLTKNPYALTLKNNSTIFGFTTGAASGSGAASIRGQRADWVFMDEVDYMADSDFDTVTAIAAERSDIGITMSSTPTGKRSHFYAACTKPEMGYTEHYHPSTHNPNWGPRMEAEFRAQLSEQGYIHEVLAEFGVENEGVFNKDKVDLAISKDIYAYNDLDIYQKEKCERNGIEVEMCNYDNVKRAPMNIFRTIGVDWDKFKASSSILILDYDLNSRNFKVIKTIEIPRAKYSYDLAVNTIVELNDKYNPAWIYCDAGAGKQNFLVNKISKIHAVLS